MPVISAMGNLPVAQGPRRRHGPVLGEDARRSSRTSSPGYAEPGETEHVDLAGADERRSTRRRSASTAAAASPSATRWSPTRSSSGRRRSRRACASSATRATGTTVERLERVQRRARDLGLHALLLLQRALPEGRRPARRDREARRRGDEARHRPRHGREAREVVRQVGEDDRLAARDRARAEDAGRRRVDQGDRVRDAARSSTARCRRRSRRTSRRTSTRRARCYDLVKQQGRDGAAGIVQGEKALERIEFARGRRTDAGEGRRQSDAMKVAYYKGCLASLSAKELDISTQALAPKLGLELDELESVTCCGAGDIHEAEPDYYLHLNARILAYAEATGCDTLMTICNVCTLNLRQANWQLKNDDDAARARERRTSRRSACRRTSGDVEVKHLLWLIAEGEGYELLKGVAHKGLKGLKVAPFYGCQILRPSKLLGFEDPDRPVVARADHRGVRRRGRSTTRRRSSAAASRSSRRARRRARRADPADRAGDGGRRRRDGDAVPALPPLARRVAVEAREGDRHGRSACRSSTSRS